MTKRELADDKGMITPPMDSRSTAKDIERHRIGAERYVVVKDFLDGKIRAADGAKSLLLSNAQFYRLCAQARGSFGYSAIVTSKPGRKSGFEVMEKEVEDLINDMFEAHYQGIAASYSKVWKECQSEADVRKIIRPSYHTVRRRIKAKPERVLYAKKYGDEAATQRYQARPRFKATLRPLEWVQFDHTVVDILLVDEADRNVIVGRPWISLAICLHTRVILGFYLSLLPPSAVSVAMLIENCVMPKDGLLKNINLPPGIWPMSGRPNTIHTDNAKEFISDLFVLNCKYYDMDVQHRDIPKKHQGGHIESLIGKMMTTKIHFIRGTTGSNVTQRKGLKSEKKASITFEKLREIIAYQIHVYHETKHSGIGMTPAEAWSKDYDKHNVKSRELPEVQQSDFRLRFFPEAIKKIVPEGIEMFRRFYYAPVLRLFVRERVLVKYDPYDLSYLMAEIKGGWHKIPCVRNSFSKSSNLEMYRFQRQITGVRDGTITPAGCRSAIKVNDIVNREVKATARDKREKKKAKGVDQHKNYKQLIDNDAELPEKNIPKNLEPYVPSSLGATQRQVDDFFENDPIIYEPVQRWLD